jgi:hypothetical protein
MDSPSLIVLYAFDSSAKYAFIVIVLPFVDPLLFTLPDCQGKIVPLFQIRDPLRELLNARGGEAHEFPRAHQR